MIKDSGNRTKFETGAVRDCKRGVGRMDLLPWYGIMEVSKHCEEGALKYGEHNVDKGIPLHSLLDSASRHLAKYMVGMDDEDHLRAACWNLLWALNQRMTHPELDDRFSVKQEKPKKKRPWISVECTNCNKRHPVAPEVYLIITRSAAKTMYLEFLQAYFLTAYTTTTQQLTTAPTMKQAEEVLAPFRTALARAKGPVFQFMTEGSLQNTTGSKADRVKMASTKKGIENFLTNSLLEVRPMTIEKLQGRRDTVATVDEWLSCDIREDPIGAIEQGAAKNENYLIVAASSEGTVRNGCGDDIKMELMSILKGEYVNPHVSIWYYKLDSIEEVGQPEMWLKANPNLGKTVSYETYQLDVERAEKSPSARNDILAKRFNLPMEGYTYFFPYEETLCHRKRSFWQMPCAMGADLSMGDDFCAFTFLFPLSNGYFGVKTRDYITSYTLSQLPASRRQQYEEFMREGTLFVFDGTVLDMMQVYDDLDNFIMENEYDVRAFGYDPYNAQEFVKRWGDENSTFGVVKVIQGAKTESVPLGELKKLSEQRKLLFDEQLMQFAMGNCITLVDTNGNRKLYKQRQDQKIDAVAAMMDAYVAWKQNRDAFE